MNPEIILLLSIIIVIVILVLLLRNIRKKKKPKLNTLAQGSIFDNYEINHFIKRGGMATVFEATNVKTKETVALKIMHESLMDDDDLVDKFLSEGDILEKLNRKFPDAPIVKVFRHSRENNDINGRPFIALELVPGIDLDSFLVNNSPTINQSIKIIKNILYALKAAHSEGILHRDISPGNIMVEINNGNITQVKMIDFGVAKNEYMNKNTPDSSIHGKPPFMSPEQCRNEKLDKRSDIYSLGILFYTLLMGQPPFMSKNPLEVMSMHQTNEYPPLPEVISPAIRNIVKNLLEKDIISRYQSADEVLYDLHSEELNVENDDNSSNNINLPKESKLIEVVSDVYTVDDQSLPISKKNDKYIIGLVAVLSILFIIVVYFSVSEFTSKSKTIIFKKNDPIDKVISELRKYDINLDYHFLENSTANNSNTITDSQNLIIIKSLIFNSVDLRNKKLISIYIGSKGDE